MSKFRAGDLVLAKMKFCPPWPGKIDVDPKGQTKKNQQYVCFFGTNDHAWIQDKDIKKYEGKLDQKPSNARAGFSEAIAQINAAYELQSEAHRDLDEIRKHREEQRREQGDSDEKGEPEARDGAKSDGEASQKSEKRKSKATAAPKRGRPSVTPASAKREAEPSVEAAPASDQAKENGASRRRGRKVEPESAEVPETTNPKTVPEATPTTQTQRGRKRKADTEEEHGTKRTKDEPAERVNNRPASSPKHEAASNGDQKQLDRSAAQLPRFAYAKQCAAAAQQLVTSFDMSSSKISVISDCVPTAGSSRSLPSGWKQLLTSLVRKLPKVTLDYAHAESANQISNATSDKSGEKTHSLGSDWSNVADRVSSVGLGDLLSPKSSANHNELLVLAFERPEFFEQLVHRDATALRLLAQRLVGRFVVLLVSTQIHPSIVVELCEALAKTLLESGEAPVEADKLPCFVELSFVERDRASVTTSTSTATNDAEARDSLAIFAGEPAAIGALEKTIRDASVCKVINVGPELGSAFYITLALRALQTAAVVSTAECFAVLEKSSVDRSAYREVLEHSSMRCDTLIHALDVLTSQNFSPASAYLLDSARRDVAMFRQVAHAHSASAAMTTACSELLKRVDARRRDKEGREDVSVVYKAIVQP